MANDVRSVRWAKGELELYLAAAEEAGLPFNAWVRRACGEAAALEKAVADESVVSRIVVPRVEVSSRAFVPDFK